MKKANHRLRDRAMIRAEKRFNGAVKILALLARNDDLKDKIDVGPNGAFALQSQYGI